MNVLDLFSGIGGFSLGLERAGMRTVAFCEIKPAARRVLAKHWPNVPCYEDVRSLTARSLDADGISADVICGGFPCQDISAAGKGAGIDGERSGLWSEYARIIGELRPRFVIVENVAALLGRGLDRVLGDLATIGYDAEWHCIPASAVGAPHRRDRLWIVAYPCCSKRGPIGGPRQRVAWADCLSQWQKGSGRSEPSRETLDGTDTQVAERWRSDGTDDCWRRDSKAGGLGFGGLGPEHWRIEPDVGRVAHGISGRVDRLEGLGNAVVPQIPEIIGRAIMTALSSHVSNEIENNKSSQP